MDETNQLAVEAATESVAAASVSQDAAVVAVETVTEAEKVATQIETTATVTAAETAVALAQGQAALAEVEAAQVTQAAVAAIAENEEKEKWQDEAIRNLESNQLAMLEAIASLAATTDGIKMAIVELVDSSQSTRKDQNSTETAEILTETMPEVNPSEIKTEASQENVDGNRDKEARKKRVLRFL